MTRPVTIGVAAVLVAAVATAQSAKQEAPPLPAAVRQAVQVNKPDAQIDKLEIEKESGINLYDIEFKAGQGEIEVAEDGPEAATAAIRTAAKGQAIKQFERSEVRAEIVKDGSTGRISKLSTPKYVYEAELTEGEVEVTPHGKVIKAGK